MANVKNSSVIYLELRTKQSTTILIRDDSIPSKQPGRLNLYNTNKKEFIEYDESIVSSKLFPLSDTDTETAKIKYKADWNAARAEYKHAHQKSYQIEKNLNIKNSSFDDDNNDTDMFVDDIELAE